MPGEQCCSRSEGSKGPAEAQVVEDLSGDPHGPAPPSALVLSLVAQPVKNLPARQKTTCSTRDLGSILGSGRPPGEGNGNSVQYSCLGNPTDRGAKQVTIWGHKRVRQHLATKQPQHANLCR